LQPFCEGEELGDADGESKSLDTMLQDMYSSPLNWRCIFTSGVNVLKSVASSFLSLSHIPSKMHDQFALIIEALIEAIQCKMNMNCHMPVLVVLESVLAIAHDTGTRLHLDSKESNDKIKNQGVALAHAAPYRGAMVSAPELSFRVIHGMPAGRCGLSIFVSVFYYFL
jgi:hypothetical protein